MTKTKVPLTLEEILEKLHEDFPYLRERYGVERIAVYGSFAKGKQGEKSDIDILVQLAEPSALKFVNLAYHLEKLLGREVDLATFDTFLDRREDLRYQHITADIERTWIDVEEARPGFPA